MSDAQSTLIFEVDTLRAKKNTDDLRQSLTQLMAAIDEVGTKSAAKSLAGMGKVVEAEAKRVKSSSSSMKASVEEMEGAIFAVGKSFDGVSHKYKMAVGSSTETAKQYIQATKNLLEDANARQIMAFHQSLDRDKKLEKSRKAFRTRMLNMNKEFDAKDLKAQQAAILKAERLYIEGYRTTEVARTTGIGSKAAVIARNNIRTGDLLSARLEAERIRQEELKAQQALAKNLIAIRKAAVAELTALESPKRKSLMSAKNSLFAEMLQIQQKQEISAAKNLIETRKAAVAELTALESPKRKSLMSAKNSLFAERLQIEQKQDIAAAKNLIAIRKAAVAELTALESPKRKSLMSAKNSLFAEMLREEELQALTRERSLKASEARRLAIREAIHRKELAFLQSSLAQQAALAAKAQNLYASGAAKPAEILRLVGPSAARQGREAFIATGLRAVEQNAKAATQSMGGFNNAQREAHSLARGLSGSLNSLWMTYGALIPLLTGAAIGGIGKNIFTVGKDLEYRLKFIEALGNDPIKISEMMPAIEGSMKTPLEAAEALQALAQAGLNTNESLTALSSTMKLSTFGELGMEDAANAMTTTLAAYNLAIGDASRVGDVFAKAAATSNTSVQKITESMKQASTAAAQYKISVEETTAGLAIMAESNITGSMAGTSYRNMLKELYTPIARGAKALKALGVSAYDAQGKSKELSLVLAELKGALAGFDDETTNRLLEAIAGERGGKALRPLIDDLEKYNKTVKEMKGASGFLTEGSFKLMESVEGDMNRIASSLQQVYSDTFDGINSSIRSVMANIQGVIKSDGIATAFRVIGDTALGLMRVLTDMGPTLTGLVIGYGAVRLAIYGLNTATTLGTSVQNALNIVKRKGTEELNRETVALQTNTQAKNANAMATGKAAIGGELMAGKMAKATTFARGLSASLGVISLVVAGASIAYEIYNARLRESEAKMEGASRRTRNFTEEIRKQRQEIEEANKQALMRDTSPGGGAATTIQTEMEAAYAAEAAARANMETVRAKQEQLLLAGKLEGVEGGLERVRRKYNALLNAGKGDTKEALELKERILSNTQASISAQEQLNSALSNTVSLERQVLGLVLAQNQSRAMGEFSQATTEIDNLSRIRKTLQGQKDAGVITPVQAQALSKLESKNYQEIASGIKSALMAQTEAITKAATGLQEEVIKQKEAFSKANKDTSNLDRVGENLAKFISTGDFNSLEETIKAGDPSLKVGLENIGNLLKAQEGTLQAAYAQNALAGKTSEEISKMLISDQVKALLSDESKGGGGAYKPTRDESMANRLNNEAYKLANKTTAQLITANNEALRKQVELTEELQSKYMTERDVQALDYRNQIEDIYNKLIDRRLEKMNELKEIVESGKLQGSEYSEQQVAEARAQIEVLEASIAKISEVRAAAGQAAAEIGKRHYDEAFSFTGRMLEEYKRLQDESSKMSYNIADTFLGQVDSMVDGLANFVATGKMSIKEFVATTLAELSKMAMKIAANQILMSILGSFMSAPFSMGSYSLAGQSLSGAGAVSGLTSVSGSIALAKGGLFQAGRLTKFASGGAFTNSIANRTTVAPMAMFGEAGPEAIMPLTRMPGGDLGIKAIPSNLEGGGGIQNNVTISNNIVINSDGTSNSNSSATQNEDAAKQLSDLIAAENRRIIERELRQGGLINQFVRSTR